VLVPTERDVANGAARPDGERLYVGDVCHESTLGDGQVTGKLLKLTAGIW
jgi:hypothetical protein